MSNIINKGLANQAAKAAAIGGQTTYNVAAQNRLIGMEKSRSNNFSGVPKAFPHKNEPPQKMPKLPKSKPSVVTSPVTEDEEVENVIESVLKDLWSNPKMDLKRQFLKELFIEGEISAEQLTERLSVNTEASSIYKPVRINPLTILRKKRQALQRSREVSGMSSLTKKAKMAKKKAVPKIQNPASEVKPPLSPRTFPLPKGVPINAGLDLSDEDLKCLFEMALNGEVSEKFFNDVMLQEGIIGDIKEILVTAERIANPGPYIAKEFGKVCAGGACRYFGGSLKNYVNRHNKLADEARKLDKMKEFSRHKILADSVEAAIEKVSKW